MMRGNRKASEKRKKGEILVTVMVPVYNVRAFIEEAVDSILRQTIGRDRIHLILVDDGSTDGSGEICDRYAKEYPDTVTVIRKENGGVASARNAALSRIEGKYAAFPDPDDRLEPDMLEKTAAFLDAHPETDVCCVPVRFFGLKSGEHPLNRKFQKGTRVIDLASENDPDGVLMFVNAALYRAGTARAMHFDTAMYSTADAKQNLEVLMNNPRLGVVADTGYHYRKHGNSIIDRSIGNSRSYIPYLKLFSEWALNTAQKRFGRVPGFVQYAVMYDLQWKLCQRHVPAGVLSAEETDAYRAQLSRILSRIDDEIILAQRSMKQEYKAYAFRLKYGRAPEISCLESRKTAGGVPVGDAELRYGETAVSRASGMRTVLECISEDRETGRITLEGHHVLYGGLEKEDVKPYLLVNGMAVECERVDRSHEPILSVDLPIAFRAGFRAEIPAVEGTIRVQPALLVRNVIVPKAKAECGRFFPLAKMYESMRAYACGSMLSLKGEELILSSRPGRFRRAFLECALLSEICRKNGILGKKAAAGRLLYRLLSAFKRRELWIISDRVAEADDNGEAFFRYVMKHRPENVRAVFAISGKSEDRERIEKIGPCVDTFSFRHKLLHLLSDVIISSQANRMTTNPFSGHDAPYRDLLSRQRFVFLQHGVIQDDISDLLGRYRMNISGFVTSAEPEYRSIADGTYGYPPERIWLTGLPRYDLLREGDERAKTIVVMPTWRRYLMDMYDEQTGKWKVSSRFGQSEYARFFGDLFTNARLLDGLEKLGYVLAAFAHPIIRCSGVSFRCDPRVRILPSKTRYGDIFADASLVVTDYSSAAFDFAYLGKPVVYCQFDRKEFFSGEHMITAGYFDYDRDGFGEVEMDLSSTVERILEYAKQGCRMKELYWKRVDRFFAFRDHHNCERILDRILSMERSDRRGGGQ